MEIKATSDTSFSAYKQFYKATTKRMTAIYIILESFFALCVLGGLFGIVAGDMVDTGLLMELLFFYCCLVVCRIILPKISFKRMNIKDSKPDSFIFTDNNINIVSEAKGIASEANLEYNAFVKAYENKRYAFLYLAKDRAFIVDKYTVTGGNFDRVRDKIIEQIGLKKYVIKL